jgi:hypothetical protein
MNLDKKSSLQIGEPKHEKRDSGIAGLEEHARDIKILDGEAPKLSLLSPTDPKKNRESHGSKEEEEEEEEEDDEDDDDDDDADTEEGEEGEEGDSTENEEVVITNIDDDLSDEDESNAPPTPGMTTPSSKLVSKLKAASSLLAHDQPAALNSSSPTTPNRPISDYSSLVRTSDHTQSPSAPRPLSEHAQTPHAQHSRTLPGISSRPGIASRFRRKEARMEDISQLTMMSHDLDITVSPPTPGETCCDL